MKCNNLLIIACYYCLYYLLRYLISFNIKYLRLKCKLNEFPRFGNLNNLQFLSENGRIQKFANCLCSPAFLLQEIYYKMTSPKSDSNIVISSYTMKPQEISSDSQVLYSADNFDSNWKEYCVQLSQALCSFLFSVDDTMLHNVQPLIGNSSASISFVYWELSIKWIMKVLLAVFPCIKACSDGNEFPEYLR